MEYLIQITKARLLSQLNKLRIIVLPIVVLSFYGCIAKHYEYPLLDKQGNRVVLYGDSTQRVILQGSMNPFTDYIGLKDYRGKKERVELNYKIKGFDTIKVIGGKINLWRSSNDSLVLIKRGSLLYATGPTGYYFHKKGLLRDSINSFEDVYENLKYHYFITVDSDSEITNGLTKLLVESKILFMHKGKTINISRIDTLYRNEISSYQLRNQ